MTAFTTEDQAMLDDLNYRKSYMLWQERESARKGRLARLAELQSVFTAATVTPIATIAAIQSEALVETDPEVSGMLSNIATVMGYTGQSLVNLIQGLMTVEPAPMSPSEAANAAAPETNQAPAE